MSRSGGVAGSVPARRVEFFFDYVSPFAYLASELLPAFAERHGIDLIWSPISMLSLASFEGGLPYSTAKRAYVAVDALRSAEFHALPIQPPEPFPVRSSAALRLAHAALEHGVFPNLHAALFRAAWRERQDLADPEVLARCARGAGGDADAWLERSRSPEIEARLSRTTARAEASGVFGVPTLVLDEELFWGLDALPMLAWRLTESAR